MAVGRIGKGGRGRPRQSAGGGGGDPAFVSHPRLYLTATKVVEIDTKIAGSSTDYTGMKSTLDQVMSDNQYFGIVTALSSGINSSDTTITVVDGSVLPSANFYIRIDLEHIYVQSRSGNTLSNCVRGEALLFLWPTYNVSHASGAEVWKGQSDEIGVSSTLSGNINSSVTTFSVASGAAFDTGGYCRIAGERMTYTRSGNNFTVTRAYNYTTAASHTLGDTVYKDHGGQAPASGWNPMAGACALLRYRGVAGYTAAKARGMMNTNAVIMASKYVTVPLYTNQDYFRWFGPWVGICYDWLYSDLSANEKAYYAAWAGEAVTEHQHLLHTDSIFPQNPKEWYQKEVVAPLAPDGGLNALQCAITSNAASGAISTSLILSAATYGDNSLAASQWNKAITKVDTWLFSAMTTGPAKEGFFIEGTQYMGESYDFCISIPLIIKSAINSTAYQSGVETWAARCADYLIHATLPGSSKITTTTTGSMTIGTTTMTVGSASGWEVGDSLRTYNILGGTQAIGDVYESVVTGIVGTTFTMRDPALTTFSGKDTFHVGRFFPLGDNNQDEREGKKDGFWTSEVNSAAFVMVDLLKTANPTYASYLRYWLDNKAKTDNTPIEKVRKFIHDDITVTPVNYSALPIMWGTTSTSSSAIAIGRSSWDKTATQVQFLVGGNNFDHVHSHACAYQIRRKGVMISGEIVGYGGDPEHLGNFRGDVKYFGAKFHNTLLMNAHGSANSLNLNPEYSPLPVFMARADMNTSAGYMYCRGDASPGYALTYLNGWTDWGYANNYSTGFWRDFIYIPSADIIAFGDRCTYSIGTTSATKWIAQFSGNPTITTQRIDCNYAGQEIVQDIVIPSAATLTEVDQLASVDFTELLDYAAYSYADYYPLPSARVETVSGVSTTVEYGLQIIQLGDLGFTRKTVSSLTTTNANVASVGTAYVFGHVKGTTPTLNISYVVSGTPRNLIMGMAASTAYHVTRATNTITIAIATGSGDTTSTSAGILDFTL